MTYFVALWNGKLVDNQMDPLNLDYLVDVAKRAFNHAAKEKRKVMLNPARRKMPMIIETMHIDSPGAEFFIWNEENPLVAKANKDDLWYKTFFDVHTSKDAFTKGAEAILKKVIT